MSSAGLKRPVRNAHRWRLWICGLRPSPFGPPARLFHPVETRSPPVVEVGGIEPRPECFRFAGITTVPTLWGGGGIQEGRSVRFRRGGRHGDPHPHPSTGPLSPKVAIERGDGGHAGGSPGSDVADVIPDEDAHFRRDAGECAASNIGWHGAWRAVMVAADDAGRAACVAEGLHQGRVKRCDLLVTMPQGCCVLPAHRPARRCRRTGGCRHRVPAGSGSGSDHSGCGGPDVPAACRSRHAACRVRPGKHTGAGLPAAAPVFAHQKAIDCRAQVGRGIGKGAVQVEEDSPVGALTCWSGISDGMNEIVDVGVATQQSKALVSGL